MIEPTAEALLAVVVPTLDEEVYLPRLLDDLEDLRLPAEVVVVDGGSADATRDVARRAGVRVVCTAKGRARQLRAGADATAAPWLLFLHADSRLPPDTLRALEAWLDGAPPHRAAHFGFALEGPDLFWRFIEFGQRLRERLYGLVYGDQGLLLPRSLYDDLGGYPDVPLMEDVEMVARLRHRASLERIDAPLVTSPRRYRARGRWRVWLRNTALITLYTLGVAPEALARFYPPGNRTDGDRPSGRATAPGSEARDTLIVFAKAPRPGRVKTRLAADLGREAAAELYSVMGRRVVDGLRDGDYRLTVAYAPADAGEEVRAWLGTENVVFRPQGRGDLGERMERAVKHALEESHRVCLVGTDAPDVDRGVVEEAFRTLDEADIVLGPARDGGYYLLALERPVPRLFRDVPWSTERVLDITLQRIKEAGLTHALLPVLRDVDTLEDVPSDLL